MRSSEYWSFMDDMRSTRSRNSKRDYIRNLMNDVEPHNVRWAIRFTVGSPLESWESDMGVGKKTVRKAGAKAFYASYDEIREKEKELGNLSEVFAELDRPSPLTADRENRILDEVGLDVLNVSKSSGNRTIELIAEKFSHTTEPQVLSYAILNDISLGASAKTVMEAITKEYNVTRDDLDRAHGLNPDIAYLYDELAHENGLPVTCEPFQRIKPQKARDKALPDDTTDWVAQTKYDGGRILIHSDVGDNPHGGEYQQIRAFTRQQNEVTENLPELQEVDWPKMSFVVDGEAVGYDPDTGEPMNFQSFMQRFQRENNIEEMMDKVEIKFKLFDLLHWDEVDYTPDPYDVRLNVLETYFPVENVVVSRGDFDQAFSDALEAGHEGIISKDLTAPYHFSRDDSWRKSKPVKEPVEVVVTGVIRGTGKYSDTLGALKVSSRDETPLGRIGTGFKDHDRDKLWDMHQTDSLEGKIIEVEFEDLQRNGDNWGLRFPRYSRLRPEGEADSLNRIKEL